jgi:hypothetical protein
MNRTLCTALSLSIIASSVTGCAAKPVTEPLKVPPVYGYTLNQPLSSDEFKALSATGGETGVGSDVYKRVDDQGYVYEVSLDRQFRPDYIEKSSRAFVSQPECVAEFEVQVAQLKSLFSSHNIPSGGLGLENRTLVPGDRYISVDTGECKVDEFDKSETYRYSLSLSEQTVFVPPKRGLGDDVEDAYVGAWMTVFMIAVLPLVLVGLVVDKATD